MKLKAEHGANESWEKNKHKCDEPCWAGAKLMFVLCSRLHSIDVKLCFMSSSAIVLTFLFTLDSKLAEKSLKFFSNGEVSPKLIYFISRIIIRRFAVFILIKKGFLKARGNINRIYCILSVWLWLHHHWLIKTRTS